VKDFSTVTHRDERDHHDGEAIVQLARVRSPVEVGALLAELEANGIKAISSGDDVGGMRPSLSYVDGYRVLVFDGDLERARRVLKTLDRD
jgi:Putative prokaryotic signal transducing protein